MMAETRFDVIGTQSGAQQTSDINGRDGRGAGERSRPCGRRVARLYAKKQQQHHAATALGATSWAAPGTQMARMCATRASRRVLQRVAKKHRRSCAAS